MKAEALVGALGVLVLTSTAAIANDKLEFFEKRIRPVLVAHCLECHGAQKAELDLRLDHGSFLQREGEYGPVVVPGQPEQSTLFRSLAHIDDDLMMPLDREKLPTKIVKDFRQWIADGAVWPDEPVPGGTVEAFDLATRIQRLPWIWETPTPPKIPDVRHAEWPRGDIDRFLLAKLETEGLRPAPDAAAEIWLRRVYFALIGLPPSPGEIKAFLSDPSERARESVVDELVQSPHFGERWGRHWLDLVRYAESRGHESDFAIANAWHYRDYVIRALNQDVPYDQFVIEHIAGDLLESPRLNTEHGFNESILATAWPFFGEEVHSPVDIRQDECDRIDNKIDVLSKTFLGLTVACARCHDHKFDAISQKDYYALSGYLLSSHFRQVRFQSMHHNRRVAAKLQTLKVKTQRALADLIANTFEHHVASAAKLYGPPEVGTDRRNGETAPQVVLDFSDPSQVFRASGHAFGLSPQRVGEFEIPDSNARPVSVSLCGHASRDPIWNRLRISSGNERDSGTLDAVGRSAGFVYTPTFLLDDGRLQILMKGETQLYCAVDSHLMINGPLHKNLVRKLNAPEPKWLTVDLREYQGHRLHLQFGPVGDSPLSIFKVIQGEKPPVVPGLDIPAKRETEVDEAKTNSNQKLLGSALDASSQGKHLTPAQAAAIRWLLEHHEEIGVDSAQFRQAQQQIVSNFHRQREELSGEIKPHSLTAIALVDGSGVDERVLRRGKYQTPGEIAPRQLPRAFGLPGPDSVHGSGRRQLAQQLVDPENPLVARVMVNRIWHHLFGRGIVSSVDNFGWLGSRPSHPELLDHLAHQFVHQDAWSLKSMIKRIVLTRTYAMSSKPSDVASEQQDPDNILLHRMNIRRLEAEAIRDSLLAVSGRLDRTPYGKPIPVHLTEFVIGRGRPKASGPLDGEGRRSIYTSVRRNFLPTMMLTFDMPIPFSTVGRRNVTNVPAQTLALMNDKLVYDQAAVWARNLAAAFPDGDPRRRIDHMYWQAFGREATAAELAEALKSLDTLAQVHQGSTSDIAVWTDLCHTIFRVNEFIYLR